MEMNFVQGNKKRTIEAVVYPVLLLALIWTINLLDRYLHLDLYTYGVLPQTLKGLRGILWMPLIHDAQNFNHILSNSLPLVVLLCTLIYFYREIALRVFIFIWLGTGSLLWLIAQNLGSYHIGISGIIYGLFGFLLLSGFIKRYLPLQAISLFVAFAYGSIVWGILPIEVGVSWQGHLSGLVVGIVLAILYRNKGPQRPKYQYEIEEDIEELISEENEEKIHSEQTMISEKSFSNTSMSINKMYSYHYISKKNKKLGS